MEEEVPSSCCPNDVKNLTSSFVIKREHLEADCCDNLVTVRPSQISASFYFGDLADINIYPDLSDDHQRELRGLCTTFEDVFVRPSKVLRQDLHMPLTLATLFL